jgi:hypothetical protein
MEENKAQTNVCTVLLYLILATKNTLPMCVLTHACGRWLLTVGLVSPEGGLGRPQGEGQIFLHALSSFSLGNIQTCPFSNSKNDKVTF